MFLQSTKLENISYKTKTALEDVIEMLKMDKKHPVVVSPFSDRKDPEGDPPVILPNDTLDSDTHLLLTDYHLYDDLNYQVDIKKYPSIVFNDKIKLPRLPVNRFYIKKNKDQYYYLFMVLKMFECCVITKEKTRTELFCQIFQMEPMVLSPEEFFDMSSEEKEKILGMEAIFVMEKCNIVSLDTERLFVVSPTPVKGLDIFDVSLETLGKYKYRISDVLQRLSKRIVKNRSKLDIDYFKNINK